jgi:uncharacterized protein
MAKRPQNKTVPSKSAGATTRGKNKLWRNKQLDVKSAGAQREEVKVARKGAKVEAATIRQCVVTRERRPEDELLRFVLDGEGKVTPDIKRRLPGRGVWVTANRGVLTEAVKRRSLLKGLKAEDGVGRAAQGDAADKDFPAQCLTDLPSSVEGLLRRSALGALSMANKAGQLTLGFEAVARALASGGVIGLIHAAEAAEDGRRKLDRVFTRDAGEKVRRAACPGGAVKGDDFDRPMTVEPGAEGEEIKDDPSTDGRQENDPPIVELFSGEELSSALGRVNVIHAALKKGGASANFLKEAHRLSRYLEPAPAKPSKRRSKQDKV